MGNLGESFDTAWNLVKEEDDLPLDINGDPSFYASYDDSVDMIRDRVSNPQMGKISIPMRDRDNPNPHPLDGMLDDIFVSANDAYSLWDEGYEPNYDSVVEAAKSVLEAMGYKVSKPIEMGPEMLARIPDDDDWERENKDNLEPNKEMRRRK